MTTTKGRRDRRISRAVIYGAGDDGLKILWRVRGRNRRDVLRKLYEFMQPEDVFAWIRSISGFDPHYGGVVFW